MPAATGATWTKLPKKLAYGPGGRKEWVRAYMKDYNPRYRLIHAADIKSKRQQRKRDAIAYKGGKCQSCGYAKCEAALTFHHRNPDEKEYQLATMFAWKWVRIVQELDKCDLLCANCHAELHWLVPEGDRQ